MFPEPRDRDIGVASRTALTSDHCSSGAVAGLLLGLVPGCLTACFCRGEIAAEFCAELCTFFGSAAGGESEYESRGAGLEDRVESAECGKQFALLGGHGHGGRLAGDLHQGAGWEAGYGGDFMEDPRAAEAVLGAAYRDARTADFRSEGRLGPEPRSNTGISNCLTVDHLRYSTRRAKGRATFLYLFSRCN